MKSTLSIYSDNTANNSSSRTKEKSKQQAKMPNFQQEIIIPNIYAPQNFQIIVNNSYPLRSTRKALQAKKKRVQAVVETILAKKSIQVSKKQAVNRHRLSRPQTADPIKKKKPEILEKNNEGHLRMDIDERINDKAFQLYQESLASRQKRNSIMQKVQNIEASKPTNQMNQTLNFYLTEVSPQKKNRDVTVKAASLIESTNKKQPETSVKKAVKLKGWVEEIQEREMKREKKNKQWINSQPRIISRPKSSTTLTRHEKGRNSNNKLKRDESGSIFLRNTLPYQFIGKSNSLMNLWLNRFEHGKDLEANIKTFSKNSSQKQKFQAFMDMIENSCLEYTTSKDQIIAKMNRMGTTWKSQKEFKMEAERKKNKQQLLINEPNLNASTLSALINRRNTKNQSERKSQS